jgi:hypothetical protein
MIIPIDARRELTQRREATTEQDYVDQIWQQRAREHPEMRLVGRVRSSKNWKPFERVANVTNITEAKSRRKT